mgnify:CR=1 FL=1
MKTKNKILPEQEEEKTFQYRTYGKGELALLYLPNILQQSAVDRFNEWIEAAPGLKERLLASCMYALGGFLVGAKAGGASTNTGNGYELEAIAACTIGGVSTNGGVGKVSGVLVGVLVFEVLKICLQFLGVDPAYTYIAQGLVIVIAVALDLRKYLAKK